MSISTSYRLITSVLGFAILLGVLVPSGLQAKHFLDFCMAEMNHHEMMNDSHDCCHHKPDKKDAAQKSQHDCEGVQICSCLINEAPVRNQTVIPSTSSSAVILQKNGFDHTVFSSNETIRNELQARIGQHDPPLYLLYDTFLN